MNNRHLQINFGPQHPSTHGVFRMILTVNGENIIDLKPVLGYLHRGIEKLAENRKWHQVVTLTDRLDYLSAMSNNMVFCLSVEKLAGLVIPERASYLRVLALELNRIASHLMAIGSFGSDLGGQTIYMYTFRDREKTVDLLEELCGNRLTYHYIRIGGVSADLPLGFEKRCKQYISEFKNALFEYKDLMDENEVFKKRAQNIGLINQATAMSYSLSGPNIRACGVARDLRKDAAYAVYSKLKFKKVIEKKGDVFARYRVRFREIEESLKIIEQVIDNLPAGDLRAKVAPFFNVPEGETYQVIEAPRGELGCYLISDGKQTPFRCRFRTPSFLHLAALKEMTIGYKIADAIAIFGSLDIVMGDVDK